jgi:phospholipid/cholesterol/gamma-HCH transport system substrate-binding protein
MIAKVNYTWVGLFVLLLGTAFFTVLVGLLGGTEEADYKTYVAYMRESVSGLNPRSPVKFKGVGVGQVREISIDEENPERVKLHLDIVEGTPVKEDTFAVITMQGITGLAYVELKGGSKDSPSLAAKKEKPYPVIKTKPSLISQLDMAIPDLLAKVTQMTQQLGGVAERLNHLLDDGKQASLANTLKHMEEITKNAAETSSEFPELVNRAASSLATMEKTIGAIQRTTGNLDRLIMEAQQDVSSLSNDALPQIPSVLADLRELSQHLRGLTKELEQNPSSFVFGRPRRQPGPGE